MTICLMISRTDAVTGWRPARRETEERATHEGADHDEGAGTEIVRFITRGVRMYASICMYTR